MRGLSDREKGIWAAMAAAVLAAIAYSAYKTIIAGVYAWSVAQPEYIRMLGELSVLFLLYVLIGRFVKEAKFKAAGIAVVTAVFLWIHVVLIPVMVSGLYLMYICMAGGRIRRWLRHGMVRNGGGRRSAEPPPGGTADETAPVDVGRDFLAGSLAVICMFCVMSAAGIGSIPQMCAAVAATAVLLLLGDILRRETPYPVRIVKQFLQGLSGGRYPADGRAGKECGQWSGSMILGAAFVLTMFCLQAGRMNTAVDYDTLWYGSRAAYILNNGKGIYENLGTVSVVYTYSKGWETLMLPLTPLPSYSFLTASNWWLAAGILAVSFGIAEYFMNRRMASLLAVFLSSLPCIMNMTITSKTDIATLLVQLLMIREILRYIAPETVGIQEAAGASEPRPRRAGQTARAHAASSGRQARPAFRDSIPLWYGLAAFLLSWTFKPTALIFSTAVCGMSFLYLVFTRSFSLRVRRGKRLEAAGITALAVCGLAGIWGRTWLLTGLPVTSVFSSILIRLGFTMKYPYRAKSVLDTAGSLSVSEKIGRMAERLYGIFLDPDVSQDLNHVIIAWGGLTAWVVLWIAVLWLFLAKKRRGSVERRLDGWFQTVFWPFLAVNLVCLFVLGQVDGNYFMLLYVLLMLGGLRLLARLGRTKMRRALAGLLVPVMAFSAVFSSLSNWAWNLGLSPVNVINRGYYDQRELRRAELASEGNGTIWEILAQDPRNRVIIAGHHPEDLVFPCCSQSYTDLAGGDGNREIGLGMENFVDFMTFAKTDYVYINADWVADRMGVWQLMYELIEYGYLVPIHYEEDNMLAEVCLDGRQTDESEALSGRFMDWRYQCLGF